MSRERTRKELRARRVSISWIRYVPEKPDIGIAAAERAIKMIGTASLAILVFKLIAPLFFFAISVSPSLSW